MAKRKYRQYVPGRNPGVTTTITAIRDIDLSEVDGHTRLKPGESIVFDFDLSASVRSYTAWKNIMRQVDGGACTLLLERVDEKEAAAATEPVAPAHEVPPTEITPELLREQAVIAKARLDSVKAPDAPAPQEGKQDPQFALTGELPGAEAKPEQDRVQIKLVESVDPSDAFQGGVDPASAAALEVEAKAAEEATQAEVAAPIVLPAAVEIPDLTSPTPEPIKETYNPEAKANPSDYASMKRSRTKKAK